MRVFVTGATGWVGAAVVKDLIAADHEALGLCRSEAKAAALAAAGAEVLRGSLEDVDSLKAGAARSDGVIHVAFNHDFSRMAENGAVEQRAIEAIGAVLEGSGSAAGRHLGYRAAVAGECRNGTERAPPRL